jgi:dephospho-CoA kinase
LVQVFGDKILSPQKDIDRRLLAQMAFQDSAVKIRLEEILHPLIQSRVAKERQRLEEEGRRLAFYDVPLLFEKNLQGQFELVVTVWCPDELRLRRLMARSKLSEEEAQNRLKSQLPQSEKIFGAGFCIDNSGSEVSLVEIVDYFLDQIEKMCD